MYLTAHIILSVVIGLTTTAITRSDYDPNLTRAGRGILLMIGWPLFALAVAFIAPFRFALWAGDRWTNGKTA